MDKIKKVFSPGSSKDDEVMYGDTEQRRRNSVENQAKQDKSTLHPAEGSEKKEHSILRQILNPGGDKHDDQRFGKTATTTEPERDPNKLETHPDHKEHTIAQQLLNPAGDKYDETRFGGTAATPGEPRRESAVPQGSVVDPNAHLVTDQGKKDHSILQQIINPHRLGYDETAYGTTAHADGSLGATSGPATTSKDSSIVRQVLNPNQEKYDPTVHGTSQPGPSTAGPSQAGPSNLGRDAAIAGGATAAGGTAYAATRDRHENQPSSSATQPQSTQRDAPQSTTYGPQTTTTTTTTTTSSAPNRSYAGGSTNTASSAPAPGSTQSTMQNVEGPGSESHLGRDAAIAGGGAAALGAGGYATHEHNKRNANETGASSTLDAKPQTDGLADNRSATQAAHEQSGSHLGRDAAIAGGTGLAGGAAASQLGKSNDDYQKGDTILAATGTAPVNKPFEGQSGIQGGSSSYGTADRFATSNLPQTASSNLASGSGSHINPVGAPTTTGTPAGSGYTEQIGNHPSSTAHGHINPVGAPEEGLRSHESHLGRDAGIGAGIGAVGAGATYAATRSNNETGPESTQLNTAPTDVQNATYTARSYHVGGTGTATGEQRPLEPHVPGEFPVETGEDAHDRYPASSAIGSTAGGSQVAPLAGTQPSGSGGRGIAAGTVEPGLATAGANTAWDRAASSATTHPGGSSYPSQTSGPTTTSTTGPTGGDHHGRDAALTGGALGAGALGAGAAYEASRDRNATTGAQSTLPHHNLAGRDYPLGATESSTTGTVPSTLQATAPATSAQAPRTTERSVEHPTQASTSTTSGQTAPSTIQGTAPATSAQAPRTTERNIEQPTQSQQDHHYGRDAAVAGGAGALGAGGIYEATRDRDQPATHTSTVASMPYSQTQAGPAPTQATSQVPTTQRDVQHSAVTGSPRSDVAQKDVPAATGAATTTAPGDVRKDEHHYGRDAAIAGGAGAAGAGAAYAAGKDRPEHTTQDAYGAEDPNKHNKLHKPAPDDKKAEKEAEKEQKQHEKEVAKEHKQHEKELEKEQKQHEKEAVKEQEQHEKEAEKQHKKDVAAAEKQHEKDQKAAEKQHEKDQKEAEKKHQKEVAAAEKQAEKDRKKAEKEEKPSLIDRIFHRHSEDKEGRKSSEHEKEAATGAAAAGTAGAGAAAASGSTHPHTGAHGASGAQEGTVIEPHTGLPMNVGKYGDGHGGTDGAQQISGYHETDPALRQASMGTGVGAGTKAGHHQPGEEGVAGPDWDAIKKSNTPY